MKKIIPEWLACLIGWALVIVVPTITFYVMFFCKP